MLPHLARDRPRPFCRRRAYKCVVLTYPRLYFLPFSSLFSLSTSLPFNSFPCHTSPVRALVGSPLFPFPLHSPLSGVVSSSLLLVLDNIAESDVGKPVFSLWQTLLLLTPFTRPMAHRFNLTSLDYISPFLRGSPFAAELFFPITLSCRTKGDVWDASSSPLLYSAC